MLGTKAHINQILFKGSPSKYLHGTVNVDSNGTIHPYMSFANSNSVKKVNIEKGELPYKDLTFYSLDKIVASYTREEALALTSLPQISSHPNDYVFNG
jgi:hypothetical protein